MREIPSCHTVDDTKKEGCEGHGAPAVCLAHRDLNLHSPMAFPPI